MLSVEKQSSGLRNRTPPVEARRKVVPTSEGPALAKVPRGATPASRGLFGMSRTNLGLLIASLTLSLYALVGFRSLSTVPESYALCSPNGPGIFTVDDARPRAQCLVVHRSRFTDIGTLEEVTERWKDASYASRNTSDVLISELEVRYILEGHIIVPGLSDSHAHILEYGAMKVIPLEETRTVEETVLRVRDYILEHPDIRDDQNKFIEGWGWDHTKWKTQAFPTAAQFEADPVVADRLIVLQSKDGHALWVSKRVLQSIGTLPDEVPGGLIVRDASGKPTGAFLDNAQTLVERPKPTHETLEARFNATVKDALAAGLTSIHDAALDPMSLEFFQRQAEDGKLPLRIYGMTFFDETKDYWGNRTSKIIGAGDDRLTARSVKIFADGALRTGLAALYEPYADNPSTCGVMRIEPDVLNSVIPKFMKDGWQVNVHAIGDRANGIVLDAFEEALKGVNVSALRPRLEHAQILTQADMARFGKLGVIASIQPTHATDDMWYSEERLGPERVKGLYAFRSILDHGARITLGSDFPVEGVNPLAGFYAAITRLSQDGRSPHGPGGWFPEQRMTREEALKGMTIDPAYASFSEDTLGSITPGKRADFVVLSQDIMSVPVTEIMKTEVVATVIDGRPAHGAL
ncbi:amidohydrolase family-domain-containing protein [Rhodofomes roseus]|uniref:Amidohydrolase family-domain-containing protein n=1 Tax=Rhodofomes roseus TaxID=34475 RepID=A0ABQ8K380_9APHY|nr:amidohydrolase family-domain-containing protein [Rhodofomes roseus]KAH9830731.1 amidohydrolase family-domain-containing protein [Rhodofomes roseus]